MEHILRDITIGTERAYYNAKGIIFDNITIDGPEDGESAFKEGRNLKILNSKFYLRYPLWHDNVLEIQHCYFAESARAPLWYGNNIVVNDIKCYAPKTIRECSNVNIQASYFESEEFGWFSNVININETTLIGEYAFFKSRNIDINRLSFRGKYSFQYVKDMRISNSYLDTKDAFWHSENVTVTNSIVKGEYLGWYSKNLTLVNCKIIGTQPLCYAQNVNLVNCEFIDTDLCFENSEVYGNIISDVISIKNPAKGSLIVRKLNKLILDNDLETYKEFHLQELEKIYNN